MGRNLEAFIKENYKKAIDRHEIQAFYQPVIRTSMRQLCSFEALARWIDPEIGMIYPDEFIPVLEREGVIHLLDAEIIRQLKSVPVIVLTVDHKAEVECLKIGAMDFIPKPYPDIDIVKARIEKCIAVSEKYRR